MVNFFKKNWNKFSNILVEELKKDIGENKFSDLTRLAQEYNLFNYIHKQMRSHAPLTLTEEDQNRKFRRVIVTILTDLCSKLGQVYLGQSYPPSNEIIEDMELLSKLALCIHPDWHPAAANLAILYFNVGRIDDAKRYAQKAIGYMDIAKARDNSIPKDIKKHMQKVLPGCDEAEIKLREFLVEIKNA